MSRPECKRGHATFPPRPHWPRRHVGNASSAFQTFLCSTSRIRVARARACAWLSPAPAAPRSCLSPGPCLDADGDSREGGCGARGVHRDTAWAPRVTAPPVHTQARMVPGSPGRTARLVTHPGAQSQRPRRASGFQILPFPVVGGPGVLSFNLSTGAKPARPAFLGVSEPEAEGSGGPCPHSPRSSSRLRGQGRRGPRSVPPHSTASELGRGRVRAASPWRRRLRCPGCDQSGPGRATGRRGDPVRVTRACGVSAERSCVSDSMLYSKRTGSYRPYGRANQLPRT